MEARFSACAPGVTEAQPSNWAAKSGKIQAAGSHERCRHPESGGVREAGFILKLFRVAA
jgi:hypothetical protein